MIRMLVVNADNTYEVRTCTEDTLLETLQQAVGGYITTASLRAAKRFYPFITNTMAMLVNDDGHNLGLPMNDVGTLIYNAPVQKGNALGMHPIVGNVVFIGQGPEDFVSLSIAEVNALIYAIGHVGVRPKYGS